jgi:hypothetical protein
LVVMSAAGWADEVEAFDVELGAELFEAELADAAELAVELLLPLLPQPARAAAAAMDAT